MLDWQLQNPEGAKGAMPKLITFMARGRVATATLESSSNSLTFPCLSNYL